MKKLILCSAILASLANVSIAQNLSNEQSTSAPSLDFRKVAFIIYIDQLVKNCQVPVSSESLARLDAVRDTYIAKTTASGELQPTALGNFRNRIDEQIDQDGKKECEHFSREKAESVIQVILASENQLSSKTNLQPNSPSDTSK